MSGKYVFTKSLKELRFLFCQTSEQSAATRYVLPFIPTGYSATPAIERLSLTDAAVEVFLEPRLPDYEETQPLHSHHDARGCRHRAAGLCQIRYDNELPG